MTTIPRRRFLAGTFPWWLGVAAPLALGSAGEFVSPLVWKKLPSGCTERFAFSAVFDAPRERVLVFAGETKKGEQFDLLGDLWECSAKDGAWKALTAKGTAPVRRAYHSATFDTKQGAMWLFGGSGQDLQAKDDLWRLDAATCTWTKLEPQGAKPGARFNAALHYDPTRHQLVMHSGCKQFFQNDNAWPDLWVYDIASNAWTQKKAEAPARWQSASALAPELDALIVQGGFDGKSTVRGDTWIYSLKTDQWTDAGKGLRATDAHCAVWDPIARAMIVYGGATSAKKGLDELGAFDPKTKKWTKLAANGEGAGSRAYHVAVWSPGEKGLWVFGGTQNQFSDALRTTEPWSVRLHK